MLASHNQITKISQRTGGALGFQISCFKNHRSHTLRKGLKITCNSAPTIKSDHGLSNIFSKRPIKGIRSERTSKLLVKASNGKPLSTEGALVEGSPGPSAPSTDDTAGTDAAQAGNATEKHNSIPSEKVLNIWRKVDAVCFDVDCTCTVNDSLDLLAEFMGVKNEVADLTNKAMDGSLSLTRALEERLKLIDCTPADIRRFLKAHPPESRLAPGIKQLVSVLQQRGVAIYLISGGFRELTLPIAAYLGIPRDRVFANRMNWQWDDETGEPSRLVGFDLNEPTAHNRGKPQAIARIRQRNPYNTVVMVGDGITDLEAVQKTSGADLFIGYGGVIVRPAVAAAADWYVKDYNVLIDSLARYKVAMVGSGAWACAVARMVAQNCANHDVFDSNVHMWVHNEDFEGSTLATVINERHENPKYLPGVALGENVIAHAELEDCVRDADVLLLCAPHQFMHGICKQLVGKLKPGAFAVSLTKGMRVRRDGLQLISQMVTRHTGMDCSILMGANIAKDIAREELSEAVIGYTNIDHAKILKKLVERPYFKLTLLADPVGAEMCGTLKNIVALAAGMVDGLGLGPNSKAAIIRQGLSEMRRFCKSLYPSVRDSTFLESCGIADLVATCYGGRNRFVTESWTKAQLSGQPRSFESLETELLNGQKLQGVLTSSEVQEILRVNGWEENFPLFTTVHRIVTGRLKPDMITRYEVGCMPIETSVDEEEDVPLHGRQFETTASQGAGVVSKAHHRPQHSKHLQRSRH